MAYLLHLSDLHLAPGTDRDALADVKSPAVPEAALASKATGLRDSLATLGRSLTAAEIELDAVVITGDVADRSCAAAFDLFPELLSGLSVTPDRVLIVPGNHDVAPWLPAGDPLRWEHFARLRDHGYLTPPLVGIDIDEHGAPIPGAAVSNSPAVFARDGSFVVVGLNSADHCVTIEPVSSELERHLTELQGSTNPDIRAVLEDLAKRRRVDVARVDPAQMRLAESRLGQFEPERLQVVALHHTVQPTGVNEEVKPYETQTNIGAFRAWLEDNRVDLILHGHKHVARIMRDAQISAFEESTRDFVEVAAPSIEITTQDGGSIGWLIQTGGPVARTRGLKIASIPWQVSGQYEVPGLDWRLAWLDGQAEAGRIEGTTAEEVHRKILSLGSRISNLPSPLVCVVSDGPSCSVMPTLYSADDKSLSRDSAWFAKAIAQWQSPDPRGSMVFNHGERLLGDIDQFKSVVAALGRKDTTKAIAVLLAPKDIIDPEMDFPSFSLAQFLLRDSHLHVIGVYRKQEMPHWWPVNVGELESMQRRVIDALDPMPQAGSITTIATAATIGAALPRVLVPHIDTLNMAEFFGLLMPIALGVIDDKESLLLGWRGLFDDWSPRHGEAADGNPVPIRGITEMRAAISAIVSSLSADHVLHQIDQDLATIEFANKAYRQEGRLDRWAPVIGRAAGQVLATIESLE